ncbi:MAG TPA: hypothetical protein VN712_04480 [Dermatophilaceae bacterium]|nr:hypothetical protein [Dermatophilaceae bacterium]
MLTPLARGLGVLAAVLLVAACAAPSSTASSSPSPTPSPSPSPSPQLIGAVEACSLVTVAEASTAAGLALADLAASGLTIPGACIYGDTAGTTSTFVFVFAKVYPDATAADAVDPNQVAAVLAGQLNISGSNAHVVTGIGDKAVEYNTTGADGSGVVLFVFKANVVLMIAINPTTNAAAVEQLARTAVSRLTPA